jgi:uncharacterized protein (DUF2062 family)
LQIRDKLRQILSVKESPRRIALAFSMGVFIGMSPLLGIHTILGLIFAWMFRLNKFVTVVGVYITNPWTIVPIYTFSTWVGAKLLGIDSIIPHIDWSHLSMKELMHSFGPLLLPFLVGSTLLGVVSGCLSYVLVFRMVRKNRG